MPGGKVPIRFNPDKLPPNWANDKDMKAHVHETIRRLRRQGMTAGQIALHVGVSERTALRVLARYAE